MEYLLNQIQGINTLFIQLNEELNHLLNDVDESRKSRLEFLINSIEKKREELKKRYDENQLKQFNPIFEPSIRSVQEKLDKLIAQRKQNINEIKQLLKISSNRKKMAIYEK